ncbi:MULTISPECIES: amidohydrolase [Aequorivita]|uniref:Omega-amidase YafV n=2 Tax=Aequorivita TaxID=153265 RepID=A0AB35YVJ8_9FLAO|nr:amidohydrolase [Aequorivita sp. Ant34-E75]WGF93265.1 amidohydrolase [Aequorivita sp. Ant34-E75]
MKTDLKVTIVQSELVWENAEANRAQFSKKFQHINEETDLIILPEMFTTGFSMNAAKLAEPNYGPTLEWMIQEAKKYNAAITGSVIIAENDTFFNRLFFVFPDGNYEKYDKRHTFTLAKENETYTDGNKKLIVNYKGWKICPLICYDLRFPVWARNTEDYDVLIYIANWPKVRTLAWDTLLRARAIENMAYCIGVNRVGFDGADHEYIGHSSVFDVLGKQISPSAFGEFTETVALEMEHIKTNRQHLQFLNDRDTFTLT